ncbi:MAG: Periplasmic solute binding protein [Pedosphaera sp.]|nr:Periplasmic solute binding protein [Pedosphaera sp.]
MRLLRVIGILLFAFAVVGGPNATGAEGHRLKVLTSFLPVYCFTVNVAGDLAEVENLLPPGADPHDFQFSPREMRKLTAADMIVINGLGLESWLDRILSSPDHPRIIVEASSGLKSELITSLPAMVAGEGVSAEGRAAPNPHIWLDPRLAEHAVTNILVALQKADPTNAAGYEQNARKYLARLETLDAELRAGLASAKGQPVITFHNAFPYFARRYDLKIVGVVEQVPDVQPSPRYLAALGQVIRREQVKVIFAERQSSPRLAEQIGRDYHVPVAQLDTLEAGEFKANAYEEGMRSNLRILQKTLK